MICVYTAMLPTDAHLVQHWLRRNGIAAQVLGDLMVGRGELPIQDSAPTVWVSLENEDAARALVAEFEKPQGDGKRWLCPECAEDNEPTFGSCWKCGVDHPAGLDGARD